LRKSFARRVYQNLNESENALVLLSNIFSHSSVAITRMYLAIWKETISNVYSSDIAPLQTLQPCNKTHE
jgi:hypothetical protein